MQVAPRNESLQRLARRLGVIVIIALAAQGRPGLARQTNGSAFEVASVRRNISGSLGSRQNLSGRTYRAQNVTANALIRFAFDIRDYQLVNSFDWAADYRFDVIAGTGRDVTPQEVRRMLQALLEERFRLAARWEQREMPVFALLVVRADGRLRPDLRRANDNCNTAEALTAARNRRPVAMPRGMTTAHGECISLPDLATMVSRNMGAPVLDRTGLTGRWDFTLRFAPDPQSPFPPAAGFATDPNLPSFTAALGEQLGLRVNRELGRVDVLVVDSIQEPRDDEN